MSPDSGMDWDQLGRYVADEMSPDEREAMRRWLDEHPDQRRIVAELQRAAELASGEPLDVEAALRRVKNREARRGPAPSRFAGLIAAAGVLLFAVLMVKHGRQSGTPVTYATGAGQHDTVELADGSRAFLAPATTLDVHGRDLHLSGAAYFDIASRARRGKGWVVRTQGAVIRDIGTRFSVRSYSGEPLRVGVLQGTVELSLAATTVELDSGDVGFVDDTGRVEILRGVATPDDVGWMHGKLVFRDATLQQVAADLERWYGVVLQASDSVLRGRRFSGTFDSEPADRVLDIIALALGGSVERRGDTAFVTMAAPR